VAFFCNPKVAGGQISKRRPMSGRGDVGTYVPRCLVIVDVDWTTVTFQRSTSQEKLSNAFFSSGYSHGH
jgi:hypothetical protein